MSINIGRHNGTSHALALPSWGQLAPAFHLLRQTRRQLFAFIAIAMAGGTPHISVDNPPLLRTKNHRRGHTRDRLTHFTFFMSRGSVNLVLFLAWRGMNHHGRSHDNFRLGTELARLNYDFSRPFHNNLSSRFDHNSGRRLDHDFSPRLDYHPRRRLDYDFPSRLNNDPGWRFYKTVGRAREYYYG